MLIVIARSKKKLFYALRIILLLLVCTLFLPKALLLLTTGGFDWGLSREEHPTGNPRRVEQATFGKQGQDNDNSILDSFVKKLQQFYHQER
ncbi:MAG TPA: hypothetical protein VHS59_09995 [Bacillota bacterium]|nr:hypothetical protein [Bacillota bacterium]